MFEQARRALKVARANTDGRSMPPTCRWCSRPSVRIVSVEGVGGHDAGARRLALCERHLMAVQRALSSHSDAQSRRRRLAEMEAWTRTFHEPPPFESLVD